MAVHQDEELWYQVYLTSKDKHVHAGHFHVLKTRDMNGRRVLDQEIIFHGPGINHEARCRMVLERKAGRFVPVSVRYTEPRLESRMSFEQGRINATGAAESHDGSPVPDDAMPTYGIATLAQAIYNQPEASMNFDALADSTGAICGSDAQLRAHGTTRKTPFPTLDPLWEVEWLSNEGTRIQGFYFDDEGTLIQADWGGTAARLVDSAEAARPVATEPAANA